MPGKTFIHVGLQKTATTYFQRAVFPLLEQVFFVGRPYTQENKAFNCLQYGDDSIFQEAAFQSEVEKILAMSEGRNLLISDEQFAGYALYNFANRGQIARRLKNALPDAEIILFLRGQTDLIKSLHNQYVKSGWFAQWLDQSFMQVPGEGLSLEKWLHGKREWNANRRYISNSAVCIPDHFDYQKLIDMYSRHFPKVHVFLYEDFRADQNEFIRRLTNLVCDGIAYDISRISSVFQNERLSAEKLGERIVLNKLAYIKEWLRPDEHNLLATKLLKRTNVNKAKPSAFIKSNLIHGGIFQSNHRLNETLRLGMESFPDKYFQG